MLRLESDLLYQKCYALDSVCVAAMRKLEDVMYTDAA
jgi:hypothetical protein